MAKDPDWTSKAYDAHASDLKLVGDLWSGVETMQANAASYVQRHEKESIPDWSRRVKLARLYPGLSRAVRGSSDKPFEKNVAVSEDATLGAQVQALLADPCRDGRTLTAFTKEIYQLAARDGVVHVFVDYPRVAAASSETGPTLADAVAQRAHPYCSIVAARDLLRWSTDDAGRPTMVAFRETSTELTSDGEVEVTRVRVVEPGKHTVYTRRVGSENKPVWDTGVTTIVSYQDVPLVTLYFEKDGALTARPPFLQLAHTNVSHYVLDGDYRNALRFAMCGVLFFSGMQKTEVMECLSIGPTAVYWTSNESARGQYLEQKGDAINLAVSELKKLEMEMDAEAGRPFQERVGEETATGRKIDDKRGSSLVHQWITATEDALGEILEVAAKMVNEQIPDAVTVTVWSDFTATANAPQTVESLIKLRASGDLTRKTLLQEVRRRGVIDEETDVDAEMRDLAEEEAKAAESATKPDEDPDADPEPDPNEPTA